jgi:hypothetical protein
VSNTTLPAAYRPKFASPSNGDSHSLPEECSSTDRGTNPKKPADEATNLGNLSRNISRLSECGNPRSDQKGGDREQSLEMMNFLRDSGRNYAEIHCFRRFVEGLGSYFEMNMFGETCNHAALFCACGAGRFASLPL